MNKSLAIALMMGASVFALPAIAADLPIEPAPMEPAYIPEPAFTWTGFYVGVNAGYGWGDIESEDDGIFDDGLFDDDDSFGLDADGLIAGAQVGYNYQINQFVLGVEADIQYADLDSDEDDRFFDFDGDGSFDDTFGLEAELNWFGTVRARAGFALDRFMIYATGGLAYGDADVGYSFSGDDDDFFDGNDDDDVRVGWTVGAGVEGAITDNLTAKVEYLYVDLGDQDNDFSYDFDGDTGDIIEGSVAANTDFTAHIVRAGLNYKFSF